MLWSDLADNVTESAPVGTPETHGKRSHRSQLPVMGCGARQNAFRNVDVGPPYQASPMTRQPVGGNLNSRNMNFGIQGGKSKRTGMGNLGGHLGR